MMKKALLIGAIVLLNTTNITNIYANQNPNYEFVSGVNNAEIFGTPTANRGNQRDFGNTNIRSNKDMAMLPPNLGLFSGIHATNPSNTTFHPDHVPVAQSPRTEITAQIQKERVITQPSFNSDGSIGRIEIPSMRLNVRVFGDESDESMRYGAGLINTTSAWDGNVGLAGHNRGRAGFFQNIEFLRIGDEIIYGTPHGRRVYQVTLIEKINERDFRHLQWTEENKLTLITCVQYQPQNRWVIQAIEKR